MTELLFDAASTEGGVPVAGSRIAARAHRLTRVEGFGTWLGVALIVMGVALIAFSWAQSSEQVVVARQLPYLISAGLPGLGLLVVGVTAISFDARSRDSGLRRERADQLAQALSAIHHALEGPQR